MRRLLLNVTIALVSAHLFMNSAFGQSVKIMPLGDSITRGEKSVNLNGYRSTLHNSFIAAGLPVDFVGSLQDGAFSDNNHEGHTGWLSGQILGEIGAFLTGEDPDVVLLHIGTNDIRDQVDPTQIISNIEGIVDQIYTYDPQIEIFLAKLIPRNDANDAQIDTLNDLIEALVAAKRNLGYAIFAVDHNQAFKSHVNWQSDYMFDAAHPNDTGYEVMANIWYESFRQNSIYTQETFSDDFNRANLGNDWVAHPDIIIANNELHNAATVNDWSDPTGKAYVALVTAFTNARSVSFSWGNAATNQGISVVGAALMFDAASTTGSGYLLNKYMLSGKLRLWEVKNGKIQSEITSVDHQVTNAGPGDVFRVDITTDATGHHFSCYVNGVLDGVLHDPQKKQGNAATLYSGVMMNGNYGNANNVDNVVLRGEPDLTPPAKITNLAVLSTSTFSAELAWTAPGDDGNDGTAFSYDLRYATSPIADEAAFSAALQAADEPVPSPAGTAERMTVNGLQPGTTYYFAIKAADRAGNLSPLSNSPAGTTSTLTLRYTTDNFNRTNLGSDWVADAGYRISNNELENSASGPAWDLAIYTAQKNPVEVSFRWGAGVDNEGIGQGGFAVMLDSPTLTANGYLIWWRTPVDEIRLWTITNGDPGQQVAVKNSTLPDPKAGDIVKVILSSDAAGHHFALYIKDKLDGILTDSQKRQGNAQNLYAGVMLTGGLKNNVDDFTVATPFGQPSTLTLVSGNGQTGTVGTPLANPLTVRLNDEYGNPIDNALVAFTVLEGGGTLDQQQTADGHLRLEAEAGSVAPPMVVRESSSASGGKYIVIPAGTPEDAGGSATYHFTLDKAGDYVVWGRVTAPSSTEDSFWLTIDGGPQITWDVLQGDYTTDWTWDQVSDRGNGSVASPQFNPKVFPLAAGNHTLVVMYREPNTRLDKLLITSDRSYVPSGKEEVQGYFTNGEGIARAVLTLGPTAGAQSVRASFPNLASVTFTATANAGSAAQLAKTSGDEQRGAAGQALANPFAVRVTDQFGNPIAGIPVNFVVTEGGGALSNTQPVLTDANGNASTVLTLGTTQPVNKVEARATGLSGSPTVFTATALPGNPSRLTLISGNTQQGTINTPLDNAFVVVIRDAVGYGIAGQKVTFTVVDGDGTLNGQTSVETTTDSLGSAMAKLTLGPVPGATNRVRASSSFGGNQLTGSPIDFTATAAGLKQIGLLAGNNQAGRVNTQLSQPIQVKVIDELDKAVPGWAVKLTVTAGGGKLDGTQTDVDKITNSEGIAEALWTLGPVVGTNNNTVTASTAVNGQPLNGSPVQFQASANLTGAAARMVIVSGNGQTGVIGNLLPAPLVAKVADEFGNGIANHAVLFEVKAGGGLINGAIRDTVQTGADGVAQVALTLGIFPGDENNQVEASAFNGSAPLTGSPLLFKASAKFTVGVQLSSFMARPSLFNGITLEWQTSAEEQNAGFNVLRSTAENGTYKQLNNDLIAARRDGKYSFEDKSVTVGVRYYYRIEDVDLRGGRTQHGPVVAWVEPPADFTLGQNYPNPFNPTTTIQFQIPEHARVQLRVLNLMGQVVRVLVQEDRPAGYYTVVWDGRNDLGEQVGSGLYWYRLEAGGRVYTKKMIVAK